MEEGGIFIILLLFIYYFFLVWCNVTSIPINIHFPRSIVPGVTITGTSRGTRVLRLNRLLSSSRFYTMRSSIDGYVIGLLSADCISMNLNVYKIVQTDSNHFHSIFRSSNIVYHSKEIRKCSSDNMFSIRVWNISHLVSVRNNRPSFEYVVCLFFSASLHAFNRLF